MEGELIKLKIDFTKKQGKIDHSKNVSYLCPACLNILDFHSSMQVFRVTCRNAINCGYMMM